MRRNRWMCGVLGALLGLSAGLAAAQSYPTRPIRFIVPIAPGGQTDLLARLVGQKLSEKWHQPVVVDNRAGANTLIGMTLAAKAAPDGYTLTMASTAMAINAGLVDPLPYDGLRDFAPITNLAYIPFLLAVHAAVPARSVQELIALAKTRPRALTFGSGGTGSPSHLSGELLKEMARIDATHVPYKGLGQSMVALLAGEVDFLFAGPLIALPQIKAGKLRALAVGSAKRFPALPNIPTVAEAGLSGYEAGIWFGILAPAGTPRTIVSKLNAEIVTVLALPEVKQRFEAINAIVIGDSPDEFTAFIKSETAKWSAIAKKLK